ncbi:NEAT domain-containing protein [Virgibacillus sp. YIM 98842]|uniref:NEAT domain-containing protein n=1 Tax=Virgibacillus sp. YIM 98842 TaxID=2663533 RepID=UPI0013DD803F|nr:NEAT domain-containing protein [Virgibacillus sp. YIM 98842]
MTDSDATNNYFENPVTLFTKDGQKYIQMNGIGGQFIKSLTINGEEVKWGAIKSDGTFAIQFELEGALSDELDFGMVIAPPIPGMGEQTFHVSLSFAEELMGSEPDEDEDSTPGNPDETDSSDGSDDDRDTEVIDDKHPALIPEKAFTINYDILKEDGTESISNDLFEKPALLLEKDNSKYVQITINNGHMVRDLSNKYGDALLVKENTDGSITVQFKVDNDLSDMLLSMRIVVGDDIPGSPGELSPDAVIVFHKDTIEEISVGDHMLVGTNDRDNENGPFIDDDEFAAGSLSSDNPEKPKLGPDQEDNGSSDENGTAEQGSNPKTGDTFNIMLYVLLLVGSAIPLALQLKRRFT